MATKFKTCSVPECSGNAHKSAGGYRSLCCAHYNRWRAHGDPLSGGTPKGELLRYLEDVILTYEGQECLVWPYSKHQNGYGKIKVDGKMRSVHRIVCEHINGPAPTSEHEAAHSCGKGHLGCCAPGHLEWKTHTENMADKLTHGTDNRGEKNPIAKLTKAEVLKVRSLDGIITQRNIAKMFSVSQTTISEIIRRDRWAWLD